MMDGGGLGSILHRRWGFFGVFPLRLFCGGYVDSEESPGFGTSATTYYYGALPPVSQHIIDTYIYVFKGHDVDAEQK